MRGATWLLGRRVLPVFRKLTRLLGTGNVVTRRIRAGFNAIEAHDTEQTMLGKREMEADSAKVELQHSRTLVRKGYGGVGESGGWKFVHGDCFQSDEWWWRHEAGLRCEPLG